MTINTMIQLSDEEKSMLTALQTQAEMIAPFLKEALADRLNKIIINPFEHPELLAKAFSYWFVNLFRNFDQFETQSVRSKSLVSLQLLVVSLDLVLHYGYKVASYSANHLLAIEAFNKALTCRMLEKQQEETTQLTYLYELCLLD